MTNGQQQNSCYICLNENVLCCSEKVEMKSEILQLLKFLIVNVNIETLENVVVGMGCLKEIVEACEYKYKNLKVSSEILKAKIIPDSKETIICQKCEMVFHRNVSSRLVDCVKHVDWLDFVNYVFENPDMEYLEKSYICNSCRISVSSIQHILTLLYIYDQSKIQYIINNCDDTKATRNKDSAESEVTIKEEIYSNNLIKNEPVEIVPIPYDDHDYFNFNYKNFKLKNEEIDLKLECSNCDNPDTDQSTHGYEKVEKGYEVNYPEKNELEKVKKNNFLECEIDGITNQIKKHPSRDNVDSNKFICQLKKNIENKVNFIHTFGTKKHIKKLKLDDDIAKEMFLVQHTLKNKVKNDSKIFKCQYCPYKTCQKSYLIRHIKRHRNIKEFKCTYCSQEFTSKSSLNRHLFNIHKCRDVLYTCDQRTCAYLKKGDLLQHKIQHGITDGIPTFKCNQCTFETYYKRSLVEHLKRYENFNFKCTVCPKRFAKNRILNHHLLRAHNRDVTKKIYNCDHCSYEALGKRELLLHKLKHGIKDAIQIFKCHQCTYRKSSLCKHVKIQKNIKDCK